MSLARRPTFSLTAECVIRTRRENVMRLIQDPWTWPRWVPEIVEINRVADSAPSEGGIDGRASMLGFEVDGHARVLQSQDDFFANEVTVGVRMAASYQVEETSVGCRVTHRFEVVAPGGPAGKVLGLMLRGRLRKMQRQLLRNLAAAAIATSQRVEPGSLRESA